MTVDIRETPNGKWWASTTYKCQDLYQESDTIHGVELLMIATLRAMGYKNKIKFSAPKPYPKKSVAEKSMYHPYKIDRKMV